MLLGDLLAHTPLALELETSNSRLDVPVKGAHAIDLLDPAPWIDSGYVVLTTGIALRGSAERQREFVCRVADAGGVALGLAVNIVFKATPRPFLQVAEECGLALFTVPYEVPFRDIIRFVTASTLRDDAAQLARVIAIQDDLFGVLERGGGEQGVVERLGLLLDARIALFAPDGGVVAAAGSPPLSALWELISSGARARTFRTRGYALVRDVEVAGTTRLHLAVLVRNSTRLETVVRPAVNFATRALQMLTSNRQLAAESDRLSRTVLLEDVVSAQHLDRRLVLRLRSIGFDSTQPLGVLAATPLAGLVEAVDAIVASGGASLTGVVGDELVSLFQSDPPLAELEALTALEPDLYVGLSDSFDDFLDVPLAIAEARACLRNAVGGGVGHVVSSEQLALADAVIANLPRQHTARLQTLLASFAGEKPEVLDTLIAFFEHDMDIMASSRALYLHPNSLRYRLSKIEAKLGRSLRSPSTIADLHLALKARALRADQD